MKPIQQHGKTGPAKSYATQFYLAKARKLNNGGFFDTAPGFEVPILTTFSIRLALLGRISRLDCLGVSRVAPEVSAAGTWNVPATLCLNKLVDEPGVEWYITDFDIGDQIGEQCRLRIHQVDADLRPGMLQPRCLRSALHA